MKNGIFQNLANLYVPNFKMEYSKNFKKIKYVPGARKVEPGLNLGFSGESVTGSALSAARACYQ